MTALEQPGFEFAGRVTPTPDSIDYNGHMNVGYYGVFFDKAADFWLARHGMSEDYIKTHNASIFISEAHTRFFREVLPDGQMDVYFRVEDVTPKALHAHLIMIDPATAELNASVEILWLSVDLATRRVAPMKGSLFEAFAAAKVRHHQSEPAVPLKATIAFRR